MTLGAPTNPQQTGHGFWKSLAEVLKAFAMEKFWQYIKLGDLPSYAKGAVAICFMLFVGCTTMTLFHDMPWWATFIMFIYMTLFYFACMIWSTLKASR